KDDEPGKLAQAGRLLAFGAWPHRLDAPVNGEVLIPVGGIESRGIVHSRIVRGRSWFVLPTNLREYTLLVGNQPVTVRVPLDFDWAVYDGFFSDGGHYSSRKLASEVQRRLEANQFEVRVIGGERVRCVRTGRRVEAGERVFSFDELTGDQLFVDRVSYHFAR